MILLVILFTTITLASLIAFETKKYLKKLNEYLDKPKQIYLNYLFAYYTHKDSRYFYKKKGSKNKHKFLSFLKSSIQDDAMFCGDSEIHVFNIICDKKIYSITTFHIFNKRKLKKINEIANYICEKYKSIDWI